MRVLVACEFSGIVRTAFRKFGHDAYSADLLPSEIPGPHFEMDLFNEYGTWQIPGEWDLIILHPPCTHLAVSGARWFDDKREEQRAAVNFFMSCINAPAHYVAVENPVSIMSRLYRKPDQYIHPWQFGHIDNKKTCLWLKNLPKLTPTKIIHPVYRQDTIHRAAPGPDRWKFRSRTFPGIAEAMAEQWGNLK